MSQKQKTVLVIDDDEAMRDTLTGILRREYRVLRVASGEGALPILSKDDVDLVLLDVRLPDGVGLDLARELREDPGRPAVMILSASVLPSEVERARAVGVDEFVPKPYRPMELVERIARLIESRPAAG